MTNDTPRGDYGQPLNLTEKTLARVLSNCLKWIGFRPGAPIYRAKAEFTLADLKQALFPDDPVAWPAGYRSQAELQFTTMVDRDEIRMHVTAIREYDLTGDTDFAGDLFPVARYESRDHWSVEGLLLVPDLDELASPGSYTLAVAGAYDGPGETYSQDPTGVPPTPDDAHLKVVAVISCDSQRRIEGAVVQRLPSPADQILEVPPL